MRVSSRIFLSVGLLLGVTAIHAVAQTPLQTAGEERVDQTTQSSASRADDSTQNIPTPDYQEPVLVGSLNGYGLISLNQDRRLIFSTRVGGGWDTNPNNTFNTLSTSVYSISPYVALHGGGEKSEYLLQYQPTFLGYPSGRYASQTMHAATAQVDGNLSERLQWKFNVDGSYGQNGARFLAPTQTVPVGGVPGTGSGSASFLPNSSSVTYLMGSFETYYKRSERDALIVDLQNSYNRIADFGQQGGATTIRLSYGRETSPRLSLRGYAQGIHYYGNLSCSGVGMGVGAHWRMGEKTSLTAEAGPQINSGCGQTFGYTYSFGYSTHLSGKAQLYLLASRQPMISYLGPGISQTSASAGMQYEVSPRALLGVDVSYANSSSLTAVGSYRGVAINTNYNVRIRHGFGLSYGYRGYFADSSGTGYSRNIAQISLIWSSGSNGAIGQER